SGSARGRCPPGSFRSCSPATCHTARRNRRSARCPRAPKASQRHIHRRTRHRSRRCILHNRCEPRRRSDVPASRQGFRGSRMDRQTAIDRITETENLTDGLEDDDANWLLDWGIAQVDGLVTGIKDEDEAGEKLNQLMSVMRTLNQIAADRAAK